MGKKCDCDSEAHAMITCPFCNRDFHVCGICRFLKLLDEQNMATTWVCLSCIRNKKISEVLDD